MTLKTVFGSNQKKENSGVWVDVCENDDGTQCRMLIGRLSTNNRKFARASAKRNKKYRGRMDSLPIERQLRENAELFIDTALFGWENVIDYRVETPLNGPVLMLAYNRENAIWLLNDLPDLFDLLTTEALELSNFQEADEAEAKNLEPSSDTASK